MREKLIDMKNANITNYSIVLVNNTLSDIQIDQNKREIAVNVKNPFIELNTLALKGALGLTFTEISPPETLNKEYQNGNFKISCELFPPRFSLMQNGNLEKNETFEMISKIINFGNLQDKIGKIGVNFQAIIDKDLIVKDILLKENIAKEFSGISITLVNQINELQTLNLKIAGAKSNITNQHAIYIQANFENKITVNNSIDTVFRQDYVGILESKINAVFGI